MKSRVKQLLIFLGGLFVGALVVLIIMVRVSQQSALTHICMVFSQDKPLHHRKQQHMDSWPTSNVYQGLVRLPAATRVPQGNALIAC
jgi:hypothetical protein